MVEGDEDVLCGAIDASTRRSLKATSAADICA